MMVVFEVYLARGKSADDLLGAEMLKDTGAQIMTLAEAKAVKISRRDPQALGLPVGTGICGECWFSMRACCRSMPRIERW